MPISDDKLKQYQYTVSGNLVDEDAAAKCIASIEAKCLIVDDRTGKCPEVTNCSTKYPLDELPVPEGIRVTALRSIKGLLVNLSFLPALDAERIAELRRLGRLEFWATLLHKPSNRTMSAFIRIDAENVWLDVSADAEKLLDQDRKRLMLQLLEPFAAPVTVVSVPGGYSFARTEAKGVVTSSRFQKDKLNPISFSCDLQHLSLRQALERFWKSSMHPAFSKPRFRWVFGTQTDSESRVDEILKGLRRLALPESQAELWFWWTLRSRTDFPVITQMAELGQAEVAQSLFEFEFSGGRKGQLDVAADAQGRFKLVCSFDGPGDHAKFSKLTKIKLKKWD